MNTDLYEVSADKIIACCSAVVRAKTGLRVNLQERLRYSFKPRRLTYLHLLDRYHHEARGGVHGDADVVVPVLNGRVGTHVYLHVLAMH